MKRQSEARSLNGSPSKKIKSTDGSIISDLDPYIWSRVVEYLEIEEVIALVLVNRSIHQIISDHIRIIHPYCLDVEWSISCALMNHHSVIITRYNIERIQRIVNQLIEKNEPISKFTKTFVYGDDKLDFGQVFKVFSAPARQPISNNAIPTHVNRPIVSGLEKLKITQMYDLSSSALFQLLSQCHHLRHLVIDNYKECYYDDTDDDSISYPELSSLKTIKLLSRLKNEDDFVLKILELAPNLEHFKFDYYNRPMDRNFLESLAKLCPKLKRVHLKSNAHCENYIEDDELFTFLQSEPHLEYIYINACSHINGSIYSKMGQFTQLKYFNVERQYYIYDEYLPGDEEPFTGDGVLPYLHFLNVGSEMKGVNVDHLLKMAPNVKDVGKTLYHSASNYLDIVDKLSDRLTVVPQIMLDDDKELIFIQKWLEKTTVLESLVLYSSLVTGMDFSKLKPIPSVKKLKLDFNIPDHLLREVFRVFPCVEVFGSLSYMEKADGFMDLIWEGRWPQLYHVNHMITGALFDELMELIPHLTWHNF